MNDQIEIIKNQFWKRIRPSEPKEEKALSDCSIKISKTNLMPPQDRDIDGWELLGAVDTLKIDVYKNSNYFEFDFLKSNDLIEELLILKDYAVRVEISNRLDGKKVYCYNNNNEFYLLDGRYYFQGSSVKGVSFNTPFLMTYFVRP